MVPQFGEQPRYLTSLTSLRQAQPDLLVDLSYDVRFESTLLGRLSE